MVKRKMRGKHSKKEYTMFSVLMLLVALNMAMGFATLGVYEFGHVFIGKLVGCSEGRAIIYTETFTTYSEMWCPMGLFYKAAVLFGGVLMVFLFGLLFFLIRGFSLRYFSFVTWGLSIYFNSKNLGVLGVHPFIQWFIAFVGIVLILYGEDRFVREQYQVLNFLK